MASTESIIAYNKRSKQCYKNCNYFHFSLWTLSSLGSFLFKYNLKNAGWYWIKQGWTIYYKKFSLKIAN